MNINIKSIRPFIGSKNFDISRNFYLDLGFEEVILSARMSLFKIDTFGFYLQNAYIKDWIDNTMIFVEVDNLEQFWNQLTTLNLPSKYENVKTIPIQVLEWGSECFVNDPSGILWHFGTFNDN
jgi:hypothetical protein